jgi:hypothetical protein
VIGVKLLGVRTRFLLCVLSCAVSSGCRHRAVTPPVTAKKPAEAVQEYGKASFRFITEKRDVVEGQEFEPARPNGPLTLPQYPPAALAARAGDATVVLRFVIDDNGTITQIGLSPRGGTTPGRFADEFRAAAETAVRSWKYLPARIDWVVPGTDINGDGKPDFRRVVRSETVPVYLDVRFEFQCTEGKPQVR